MKCLKCGYPRAKYVVSRKHLWKGRPSGERSLEPRKDFRVKCPKCGAKYVDKQEEVNLDEVQEKEA